MLRKIRRYATFSNFLISATGSSALTMAVLFLLYGQVDGPLETPLTVALAIGFIVTQALAAGALITAARVAIDRANSQKLPRQQPHLALEA